jgi:hypothetical protein
MKSKVLGMAAAVLALFATGAAAATTAVAAGGCCPFCK